MKTSNYIQNRTHEKIVTLLDFFERNHRWPKQKEIYKGISIGIFAKNVKNDFTSISANDRILLEDKNFFSCKPQKEAVHKKVIILLEFFERNHRWPKQKENFNEIKIGVFSNNIKTKNTSLSPNDRILLEEKGFFNSIDRKLLIHNKVLTLLEFFSNNGRWPKFKEKFNGVNVGIFSNDIKSKNTSLSDDDTKLLMEKGFFEKQKN